MMIPMSGELETDSYLLARTEPFQTLSRELANKTTKLRLDAAKGTVFEDLPPDRATAPCLTEGDLALLGEAAITLEKYFKRPQDVEWTIDAMGRLYLLQSRPLVFYGEPARRTGAIDAATSKAEVLFSGLGDVVQRGVAMGRVHVVRTDDDLDDFPFGAILVAHHTSPRYSRVMVRVLARHDFKATAEGDLVVGRLKRVDARTGETALRLVGALCAFSRQRDTGRPDADALEAAFFERLLGDNAPGGLRP